MGQPLRTIWRVTSVRITLSSWSLTQPVMASLLVTSTVPVRLGMSAPGSETLQGVVAEHPQGHDHPGLGVLDVVDAAAEGVAGVLPGADEVQLGPVGVAAGGVVDDGAEERQLVGVDLVLARAQGADHLALVDEQRQLVGVDDGPGELADVVVGPLEDDLVLLVVRYCDELTPKKAMDDGFLPLVTLWPRRTGARAKGYRSRWAKTLPGVRRYKCLTGGAGPPSS